MSRADLKREIDATDRRLQARRQHLHEKGERLHSVSQQISPLWWVGIGLVSGFAGGKLTQKLTWHSSYSAAMSGFRMYPLFRRGIHLMGFV